MSISEDYEVEVTTVITTTTRTRRSATPQPQLPHPVASLYPSTPLRRSTPLRQSVSPTRSSPSFSGYSMASPSPAQASGSPAKLANISTPWESPSQHGSIIFGRICYTIPHPNEITPSPYVHPPPKKWYAITVGQDVGVFDNWYLLPFETDAHG